MRQPGSHWTCMKNSELMPRSELFGNGLVVLAERASIHVAPPRHALEVVAAELGATAASNFRRSES